MGKRIIAQARGKGSNTYKVRKKAFKCKLKYPSSLAGQGTIVKLLNSPGHTAPVAKIKYERGVFYIPAFKGAFEGQVVSFDQQEIKEGNILELGKIPLKTTVYCIESKPKDGGVFVKASGGCATIVRKINQKVFVLMPSKKEKAFNEKCRAIVGTVAGEGRLEKPIIKAGKKYYIKKIKNKLWPRTSAVKMNAVDHPFGSGRGKNPKSKIAKRNAPPGRKVGLLKPRRTGKKK